MKRFKRFLKGVLIVILVLAVVHGIASMVYGRKVASMIADIKAQGDPVSMVELGKVDIPDSENGATVYLQIFKEIGYPITYNEHGIPQFGGDMIKKADNFDYNQLITKRKTTPEMWEKARKSLAVNQHALDMVDEAVSMPRCKFKTNWQDGPAVMFPYYAVLRTLSRMLTVDAILSARNGDMDKAVKRTGQIFKVSEAVDEDPTLISHLVKIAIVSIGLKSIRDIEQDGRISASQAKYLDNILAQIDMDNSYRLAMKGERVFGLSTYKILQGNSRDMKKFWEMMNNGDNSNNSNSPFYLAGLSRIGRPIIYLDESVYLNYMNRQVRDADIPYIERPFSKPNYNEINELPKYAILSRIILPVLSRASMQRDLVKSNIRGGRAYLGAIVYKDKFGEYPKSLNDLETRIGWKVEKDPMANKGFHYKRQGAGFLLYGVGQNLRDDNGVSYMNKSTYSSDFEHDDIVWEMKK